MKLLINLSVLAEERTPTTPQSSPPRLGRTGERRRRLQSSPPRLRPSTQGEAVTAIIAPAAGAVQRNGANRPQSSPPRLVPPRRKDAHAANRRAHGWGPPGERAGIGAVEQRAKPTWLCRTMASPCFLRRESILAKRHSETSVIVTVIRRVSGAARRTGIFSAVAPRTSTCNVTVFEMLD
jgi:hypothetical protein